MLTRPPLPAGALTLPSHHYTSLATFARERDAIFRRLWVCAGRLEDLPETGAWLALDMAGDRVLVVRDGTCVRAFFNVCRHRGTLLCEGERGRLPGVIRCPYHAWTYGCDGRLLGAPHMEGTPGFRREDYQLHALAADTWAGLVFIRIDAGGAPLAAQLGDLPGKFSPWRIEELRRGGNAAYEVAANWKLIVQNYSECLHCPTLHPQLNRLSHYLSGENEPIQPGYMGGRMDLNDGVDTMSATGRSAGAMLPELDAGDRRRVHYYAVFPNLLLSAHPDYVMTHTLWPLAPNRTRIVCEWLFHPDEMRRPGFDPADIVSFWDETNRQDWHICEQAQIGVGSGGYAPGPYSNREELLYAFDQWVLEKLEGASDL